MDALGVPFEVMPASIDEKAIIENDQKLRAKKIAKAKADFVHRELEKNNSDSIVIAADTFTMFGGKAYEKPENLNEAAQMLREQSGKTGFCYSGFAYIDKKNNTEVNDVAVTTIIFRKLSELEIEKYVNENPVLTWSAGFCPAYPAGINLIFSIEGSFSSFTHGLPMEMLRPLLERSGVFNETV